MSHPVSLVLASVDDLGMPRQRGADALHEWGVALLVWGCILVLAAAGLFSGSSLARWFAVVVVFVNLIGQFAWFPAYPLWSMVAIALDVVVLFALTARWRAAVA